jgi:hypothetical protein
MPLAGTHSVLGAARRAAESAVRQSYLAMVQSRGTPLSPEEREQMEADVKTADSAAIIAHVIANATVAVTGATGVIG